MYQALEATKSTPCDNDLKENKSSPVTRIECLPAMPCKDEILQSSVESEKESTEKPTTVVKTLEPLQNNNTENERKWLPRNDSNSSMTDLKQPVEKETSGSSITTRSLPKKSSVLMKKLEKLKVTSKRGGLKNEIFRIKQINFFKSQSGIRCLLLIQKGYKGNT